MVVWSDRAKQEDAVADLRSEHEREIVKRVVAALRTPC